MNIIDIINTDGKIIGWCDADDVSAVSRIPRAHGRMINIPLMSRSPAIWDAAAKEVSSDLSYQTITLHWHNGRFHNTKTGRKVDAWYLVAKLMPEAAWEARGFIKAERGWANNWAPTDSEVGKIRAFTDALISAIEAEGYSVHVKPDGNGFDRIEKRED